LDGMTERNKARIKLGWMKPEDSATNFACKTGTTCAPDSTGKKICQQTRKDALEALAAAVTKGKKGTGKVAIFYFFATTGTPYSEAHEMNVKDVEEFNEAMGDLMKNENSVLIHATTFHTSPTPAKGTRAEKQYKDKMDFAQGTGLFQYDMSKILQTLKLAEGRCKWVGADDTLSTSSSKTDVCGEIKCMLYGEAGGDCDKTYGLSCGNAGLKPVFDKWGTSKDANDESNDREKDLACATSVSRALYFDTAKANTLPTALAEHFSMGMVKIPFMLSNTIAVRRLDAFYPSAYTANGNGGFGALAGCGYNALFGSINRRFTWVASTKMVAKWHVAAAKYISDSSDMLHTMFEE